MIKFEKMCVCRNVKGSDLLTIKIFDKIKVFHNYVSHIFIYTNVYFKKTLTKLLKYKLVILNFIN
uniref:Uncharacterized protein n=1 Tax=Strongyloides venezuelensis TaxID=75913 RepID=A0A0K0ETS9_STRVS